jgi:hypothetical protein
MPEGGASRDGLRVMQGAPPRAWFYGVNINQGLLLKGTRPMNFLRDKDGGAHDEDWGAFQVHFNSEMERVLSL